MRYGHFAICENNAEWFPQSLSFFKTGEQRKETATNPNFDLVAAVVRRRLRFAGHILCIDENRLLRRTFIAHMNGL